jgi:tripartite-type tricarboxylate transporter receptor subunit TctC
MMLLNTMQARLLRVLFFAMMSFCFNSSSFSQSSSEYPNKPIRLIVGFSAGGGSDTSARLIAPKLSEYLGQSVIIENKPGAGGNLASEYIVKSPADGYTILLTTIGSLAINPNMPEGTTFDPLKDFSMITQGVTFSNILVVKADSPIKNLKDFVQAGKDKKVFITFGSSGNGSTGHLAGELLKIRAGMDAQHINYKGGGPAMNDLLGGNITAIFASTPTAIPFIEAGRLRAIGVTGSKRAAALPNVPTIAEQGYPGYQAENWYAFVGPPKMPTEVVTKLNIALTKAMRDSETLERLHRVGLEASPCSPAELYSYVKAESESWGKIIKKIQWEK